MHWPCGRGALSRTPGPVNATCGCIATRLRLANFVKLTFRFSCFAREPEGSTQQNSPYGGAQLRAPRLAPLRLPGCPFPPTALGPAGAQA